MTLSARLVLVDPDHRLERLVAAVAAPLSGAVLDEIGLDKARPVQQWAADRRRLQALLWATLREPHWSCRLCFHDKAGLIVILEPRAGVPKPMLSPDTIALLQAAVAAPHGGAEQRLRPVSVSARKSVVLVEDECAVRSVCRRFLQERYLVLETASGAAALALADWLPWPPDLLISDINLPVSDGIKLAQDWRERWSSCPVLLLSGSFVPEAAAGINAMFLRKPFQPSELLNAAAKLLGEHAESPRSAIAALPRTA